MILAYHVADPSGQTVMQGVHPGRGPEAVTAALSLYLLLEFPDLETADFTLAPAHVIHPEGLPCHMPALALDPERMSARLNALIGE